MSIVASSLIPALPVHSFSALFSNVINGLPSERVSPALNGINRVLSVENAPVDSLREVAEPDRIARFLEKPALFSALREPLGLSVPFLSPVLRAMREKAPPATLARLAAFLPTDEATWRPYIRYADGAYHRQWVVYEPGVLEFLVLSWKSGQGTKIHEHGGAQGFDRIVKGRLRESLYLSRAAGEAIFTGQEEILEPGAISVVGATAVHRMENREEFHSDAVSLHGYYPPIQAPKTYELAKSED